MRYYYSMLDTNHRERHVRRR